MADRQINSRFFKTYVWNNFRYVVHTKKGETTYYVCEMYQRGQCKARGIEKDGNFNVRGIHTHLPNQRQLLVRSFKRDLCRNVLQSDDTFRHIYDSTRLLHPEASVLAPFASCEQLMYRWRRKTWPETPHNLQMYSNILNGNEFENWKNYNGGSISVSAVDSPIDLSTSILFVDTTFAREVYANNVIFMDATFKIVPPKNGGKQFLTFMTIKYDHALPFAWALMERKTEAAYVSVIQELRRMLPGIFFFEAMTDFESALKSSLRSEFPQIVLYSCLFHYDQALYRKAVSLGLKRYLNTNEEGRHILRQLMALAFLPAAEIPHAYNDIINEMSQVASLTLQQFLNYYEHQWLQRVRPENFSVFGLTRRTNNVLEAYHKSLVNVFGSHPNIWNFTQRLVKYQEGLRYDLAALERGNKVRRLPSMSNVIKQRLIIAAWNDLNGPNRPTRLQFLEKIISISIDPIMEFLRIDGE